jgi:hypothetical protein
MHLPRQEHSWDWGPSATFWRPVEEELTFLRAGGEAGSFVWKYEFPALPSDGSAHLSVVYTRLRELGYKEVAIYWGRRDTESGSGDLVVEDVNVESLHEDDPQCDIDLLTLSFRKRGMCYKLVGRALYMMWHPKFYCDDEPDADRCTSAWPRRARGGPPRTLKEINRAWAMEAVRQLHAPLRDLYFFCCAERCTDGLCRRQNRHLFCAI